MNPARVVEVARTWVGVPFRHQGRDGHGIDCVGLPILVLQELGLLGKEFSTEAYGRLPTGEIVERLRAVCTPLEKALPGSLVVIAWTKIAAHTAICTGDTLIHAYEAVGSVVEHGYRGRWVRMTHSIWALPGVQYDV